MEVVRSQSETRTVDQNSYESREGATHSIKSTVQRTIADAQRLVREEWALARLEASSAGRRMSIALGAAVLAVLLSTVALLRLSDAAAWAIGADWPDWGKFLLSAGILIVVTLVVGLTGLALAKSGKHKAERLAKEVVTPLHPHRPTEVSR